MEYADFIKCPKHDVYCYITTNVHSKSTFYKRSYHSCSNKVTACSFTKNADVSLMYCTCHSTEIISIRKLVLDNNGLQCHYRCKKASTSWCGMRTVETVSKNSDDNKAIDVPLIGKKSEPLKTLNGASSRKHLQQVPHIEKNVSTELKNVIKSKNVPTEATTESSKPQNEPLSKSELERQIEAKKKLYVTTGKYLPDNGLKLKEQIERLEEAYKNWKPKEVVNLSSTQQVNPNVKLNSNFVISQFGGDYLSGTRLYVGPNNAARRHKIVTVTLTAVERLHESLKSKPKDYEEENVEGLEISLLEHQRQGLKWASWRESQHPAGGIIADDMGLGKTILMLSIIVKEKLMKMGGSPKFTPKTNPGKLLETGCTLVICPATLIHHWEAEILGKCRKNLMYVIVYHGPKRTTSPSKLALADVIITTYDVVRSEIPTLKEGEIDNATPVESDSPLLRLSFNRIVLDEGHVIKNPKTNVSQAVCLLHAKYRWVLTGTPIHNKLKDMFSLLKFLRFSPFDEEPVWRHWVDNSTAAGQSRLKTIIETLLLRRTKDQMGTSGKPLVSLPVKEKLDEILILSKDERDIYDELLLRSQNVLVNLLSKKHSVSNHFPKRSLPVERKVGSFISKLISKSIPDQANMAKVLVLLLRMQQCCCHLSLLNLEAETPDDSLDDLVKQFEGFSLAKNDSAKVSRDSQSNIEEETRNIPGLEKSFPSTKVKALMEKLSVCLQSGKCVVVSQWSSYLEVIGYFLKKAKIEFCEISGRIPPKNRGEIVHQFNTSSSGAKVMLLSLKAGGVGLNLTGARYLFLMDIHWNPALEAQACDRIYRVGQKYDVKMFRFVCENTVEAKIVELHRRKLQLATNVLEGENSKKSRFTLEDLRSLFGV
ncbi:transcription termination factor, RNA polymerase II [Chamberlinius hualienensis]